MNYFYENAKEEKKLREIVNLERSDREKGKEAVEIRWLWERKGKGEREKQQKKRKMKL